MKIHVSVQQCIIPMSFKMLENKENRETHERIEYLVANSDKSGVVHSAHRLAMSHFCGCQVHHPAQVMVYVMQDGFHKHVC
jgi:hypothetical protein